MTAPPPLNPLLIALSVSGILAACPAKAADRAAAYANVAKSCVAETQRLCPALSTGIPQPRSQAICLRPYKSSLSLSCRRAVKAVSP